MVALAGAMDSLGAVKLAAERATTPAAVDAVANLFGEVVASALGVAGI